MVASCVGLTGVSASAHVLKVDGEISAELHIEPHDNPVSGKPISYELFFDDTSNRFSLAKCDCVADIKQNGRTIATQNLHATGVLSSENVYSFPESGEYELRISGEPKQPGAFQKFSLSYPQHISAPGGSGVQPFPRLLAVGLGVGIAVILLAAYKQNYDFTHKKK